MGVGVEFTDPYEPIAQTAVEFVEGGLACFGLDGGEGENAVVLPLDARGAAEWIQAQGLIRLSEGELVHEASAVADLGADKALELYRALRSGGDDYQPLRMLFFALCGHLPEAQRRVFAEAAGAVDRPSDVSSLEAYRGDFCGLFYHQEGSSNSPYAQGVRGLAEVLESDSLIKALMHFGAIEESSSDGQWILRVERKMKGFDGDTLMAIHDRIDTQLGFGDRK